jgi:hypothetical protein
MLLDFTEQINNYIISQMLSKFIPNLIPKTKKSINPNGFSNLLYFFKPIIQQSWIYEEFTALI